MLILDKMIELHTRKKKSKKNLLIQKQWLQTECSHFNPKYDLLLELTEWFCV